MVEKDNPGVIAPPPLIAAAALALGFLVDWLAPVYVIGTVFSFSTRVVIGGAMILGGVALIVASNMKFRAAGTNVEPWKPTTAIVNDGVYGWLRNPIYVGGMLLLIGIGVAVAGDWIVVFALIAGVILHYGVVLREERYLEGKFGATYRDYMARVSRYGWPN